MNRQSDSLDNWLEKEYPSLVSYARGITKNPHDAQELVQQSILHTLKKDAMRGYTPAERKAYLHQKIKWLGINWQKKQRKERSASEHLDALPSDSELLDKTDSANLPKALQSALNELQQRYPTNYRIFLLRQSGEKYVDLSKEQGISIRAVRDRFHRAKKFLKRYLATEERTYLSDHHGALIHRLK